MKKRKKVAFLLDFCRKALYNKVGLFRRPIESGRNPIGKEFT